MKKWMMNVSENDYRRKQKSMNSGKDIFEKNESECFVKNLENSVRRKRGVTFFEFCEFEGILEY